MQVELKQADTQQLTNITKDSVGNILEVLEEAFFDIPFDNSEFQTKNFIIASQITPARAYRAIGLNMLTKIQAIKESLAVLEINKIDIEENEYIAKKWSTSSFEKRRLAIQNIKLKESRKWTEKLLNDAFRELNYLYEEFKKYPRYTREQFEAEERLHFQVKLEQQIQLNGSGAGESLTNMNGNAINIERMLEDPLYLENLVKESTVGLLKLKDEIRTQSN